MKYTLYLVLLLSVGSATALAQEVPQSASKNEKDAPPAVDSVHQRYNLHFQATYIYQYKPAFNARYTGPNSLLPTGEKQNSLTATLYFGVRLWKGAEVYLNPELAGGSGLSGAFGLGASTNGETFRVGDPAPTLYLARGYFKQTFPLGRQTEVADDAANQLQTAEPQRYVSLYAGKLSMGDFFDNNTFSNSPRTQFMNWALMNNAAWDYAANVRGYTKAFAAVVQLDKMAYKAAFAELPTVANGPDLNDDIGKSYSINVAAERAYASHKREGHIRLMGYYNTANMGAYKDAYLHLDSTGSPDVTATRKNGRTKIGVGLSMDQELTDDMGLFARAGWNDGKNETWCFTEADQTVSLGLSLKGNMWHRKEDNAGIAVVANGLSKDHKDYLAAGGLGFQLGDGRLSYGNETALEAYYSFKPVSAGIWFSGDYQLVLNPGYNTDRGPVSAFSFRLHVEL